MSFSKADETPRLDRIEREYGDVDSFVTHVKDWMERLPRKYLQENSEIKRIWKKVAYIDWNDPHVLSILHRKVTSLDRLDWIDSVIDRIDMMRDNIRSASIENHEKYDGQLISEKAQEELKERKSGAIEFMDSVEDYALRNLKVTEKQLEALNETYKKFEPLL